MATPPIPQEVHWRDRLIARSEGISDAWEVGKAYGARVAEWILFACLFANILEMFPLLPDWFGNAVLIVQAITLDIAGFGLTTMGEHARRQGNEKAARIARRMGWTLIGLMILTVGLVTVSVLIPPTKETIDNIEKGLILARVIVTVFYGHIVHTLRQASIDYTNQASTLREEVSTLQQEVSTLRPQLDRALVQVDTLSGRLFIAQQKVSTLQTDLDTGQGDTSTLRKQLNAALVEADALRTQLDGKQQELAGLREQLQGSQQWQGSRVSSLQEQLDTELAQAATLRRQLDAKERELEGMQAAMESGRQEVSTLQRQLKSEQQRVSTLQKAVDSGQSQRVSTGRAKVDNGQESVDSGQAKVVRLDTTRSRKSGQDEEELAERIKETILGEPELSDRAIAQRLQCSPTTVGRKRKALETECVNE